MKVKLQRSMENQEYRDNLAHDLKRLRSYGDTGRELADVLLQSERKNPKYIDSKKYSEETLENLINHGELLYVFDNMDKFENLDHKKLAKKLIDMGQSYRVHHYIDRFKWLDDDVAEKLISEWLSEFVAENINKFDSLYHKEIAEKLMKASFWGLYLAENIDKFEWLNHKEIAEKLINGPFWQWVAENIDKFEWLNHKEVVEKLIERWYVDTVADNIDKFEWLNREEVVMKLIDEWCLYHVIKNMKKFDSSYHKKIAKKLIEKGHAFYVGENIDNFKWLDEEIAKKFIEVWYWKYVIRYPEKFWLKKEDN